MTENTIVCNIDLFSLDQQVYLVKNSEATRIGTTPLATLPYYLVQSCHQYSSKVIHLYGSESYIEDITNTITTYNKNDFSDNDIRIEVN